MLVEKKSVDYFARHEAGGKGYNLYLLSNAGIQIPEWLVLGKSVFEQFTLNTDITSTITLQLNAFQAKQQTAKETSDNIQGRIIGQELSTDIKALIDSAYEKLNQSIVSVRSSAADEDGGKHSFAGQLSSFLYVDGIEDIALYIKECWASAFSERGLSYRAENKLPLKGISIAVIIQHMIDPDVSGVAFSCDPLTGAADQYVLSSVYGAGEGLVSGELECDNYWINSESGSILKQEIVKKTSAVRRLGSGRCSIDRVAPELQNLSSLTADEVSKLYRVVKSIFEFYKTPQDIEWAIKDNKVYVLQSRPVTTIKFNGIGFPNLWDNSNIVESYGGVTSPLSFTFALGNYKSVYIQFCEILGVPGSVVKDMEYYLGNMLGSINGRVYYNLYNWYKLVGVLPGFKSNRQFMETMMGVGQSLSSEIEERIQPHPSWNTWLGKLRKIRTGISFAYYHFAIQPIVDKFLSDFNHDYQCFRQKKFTRMSSDELFQEYLHLNRTFLDKWKAPIINDFLCMVHFGLLKQLTSKWLTDFDQNIQNDLLAGEGDLESAEPTKMLIRMAGEIVENEELRALIEKYSNFELMEALNQSEFQSFYQLVVTYIDRFGYRCMNEMKLEQTDFYTDPSFVFLCLKNYLKSNTTDIVAYEKREKELRAGAEEKVTDALQGWKKKVYFWSLKQARKAVRNRENTRFARTRAYGLFRSIFNSMGDRLSQAGIIDLAEDIFFLTMDEIYGIYQGTLTAYSLPDIIKLRKKQYAQFEDTEPKIRFQTRGPVYWNNNYLDEPELPVVEEGVNYDLKGLACCPGLIEAKVKVIDSLRGDMNLNGEILVAKRTDPGWVPIFPSVSGLLVERGSLLSHSAIVAREMGIPAIVGVKGLLATLQTGMVVRMDGQNGTICIVEK
ncbi:MAG: phosphoenolpyruvate synthase [Methylococcaceae bacterium]